MLSKTQLIVAFALLHPCLVHQSAAQEAEWVHGISVYGTDGDSHRVEHHFDHSEPRKHLEAAHGYSSGDCGCQGKRCHHQTHHGISTDPGRPAKPRQEKPGDVNRGDSLPYRYSMPDCKRAGKPHSIALWAKCGTNKKYSVGYVGGGSGIGKIRGRTTREGTWGMDYNGFFGLSTVWLDYTRGHHGGRKQGGEGAYRTDGEPAIVAKASQLKSAFSSQIHR